MNTLCRTLRVHGLSWVSALRQPTLPLCQKRANTVTTPPTDTFGTPASATFVSLRPATPGRPSCLSRTALPPCRCRRPAITPCSPSVCGVFTARLHRFRHAITACSSRDYGVFISPCPCRDMPAVPSNIRRPPTRHAPNACSDRPCAALYKFKDNSNNNKQHCQPGRSVVCCCCGLSFGQGGG